MQTKSLENIYLVFWNLAKIDDPRVEDVRALLAERGFGAEHAADVPASTALRRAADACKDKDTEARCWTAKDGGKTRAQIDDLVEEDGRLRRHFKALYELGEDERPVHLSGAALDAFVPSFENALAHYTGADLSRIVKSILDNDGLGSYSPRKGGGVYFTPLRPEASDLLDRLASFCTAVGINLLTFDVPDAATHREEIANAIADSFHSQFAYHADCVAAYTTETQANVVTNREQSVRDTVASMDRLAHLMNGRHASLALEASGLIQKLQALVAERQAAAEAATQREREQAEAVRAQREQAAAERRQQGGRRIVPIGAGQ